MVICPNIERRGGVGRDAWQSTRRVEGAAWHAGGALPSIERYSFTAMCLRTRGLAFTCMQCIFFVAMHGIVTAWGVRCENATSA